MPSRRRIDDKSFAINRMQIMAPTIVSDHSPPDALLTEVQAAALLCVAPSTLASWRSTKRVSQPQYCRIGGAVRYRRADIESYIEASVQPGDS